MKFLETLCIINIISNLGAAPVGEDDQEEHPKPVQEDPRDKRSHYGVHYASPCAAASSPVPSIAPPAYHMNIPQAQQYLSPYTYGYNYPRYRSVDPNDNELLSFSDMNNNDGNIPVSMAGLMPNYQSEPRIAILNSQAPAQPMQSYGVFPYVNPSAVNVPLLFTCTPSIVPGQMVQPQPQYYTGYRSDYYRDIDLRSLYESQDDVQTQPAQSFTPQKPNSVGTNPQ